MSAKDIIRAWKDEDFRLGLSSAQRTMLPDNPVGAIELSDEELVDAAGATMSTNPMLTCRPCSYFMCHTPVLLCQWP